MRLADTGIWIDHFRYSDDLLASLIEHDMLLCHPAVIGELALGSLRERGSTLEYLSALQMVVVASHEEVMTMVERHSLYSMGIGYTDAHLLTSVMLDSRAELWTRDKRLQKAARKAGADLSPDPHA